MRWEERMIKGKKTSKRCFIVEGNIGVGKSTFLKLLAQRLDCHVVFEPHKKWQNIGTAGNLLEKFYQDILYPSPLTLVWEMMVLVLSSPLLWAWWLLCFYYVVAH